MSQAARFKDPVQHSNALIGLAGGVLAGAIIGALIVGTGGGALVLGAAMLGGAAAGGGFGEVLGSLSILGGRVTGKIITGSKNVRINRLPAVRASLDTVTCKGMPPLEWPPHDSNLVAQGSVSVRINGQPAARVGDLTQCNSRIRSGSSNVNIGGKTATTERIKGEIPQWMNTSLIIAGFGSAVILAGPVVALFGLAGGMGGGYGGQWLGGKLFGEGSDGQKLMMLAGSFLGGWVGARGGMQPAEWLGNRIVGRPGAFIRSGVPGIARYAPQSAETDEGALTVNRALEQAGRTNPDKRPTIGVAKSGETFRVRLSGRPKTVADAYKQIQGKLPKNYVLETTEPDVPIRPARNPDGSVFPSGEHCVERGLYAGSRANNAPIEFMSVYESSKGQFIKPCASCVLNEPNIVTGVPSGGLPQVTIPPQGQKADNE